MKNADLFKDSLDKQRAALFNAMQSDDKEEQATAFNDFFEGIQTSMMAQNERLVAELGENYNDDKILVDRGIRRQLTSKENKFFAAAVEKKSLDNLVEVFPVTIVEDVFKNLKEEHPVLSRIDAVPVEGLMKYIYSDPTKTLAFWGAVPDDIKQLIINGFKKIDLESAKLSGFLPVTKGFFKLGPNWLANYIITVLQEIMQASLEIAVISGDGNLKPIGMIKKLSGSTDGVYPDKETITMNDLEPGTLAGVHMSMAEAKTDNGRVSVLVNPQTYWGKLFPKLAQKDANNNWHLISLPTGDEIVQSHAVPKDTLIFGVLKNYFLGVSGQVELKKYEETLAIEDLDLFIAKFYGNGVAKNANAFFVANISAMTGATAAPLDPDPDIKKTDTMTTIKPGTEEEGEGLKRTAKK
ncbi:phage major capsid protein [uncultured Vagococcus sp.]|uniref:phage major capsid protein n=1 Tax=uncultured Vagococcus sp. TaxID=189676 RepID=UPI0028D67129|nr:phage major capsid protein [uncultured Vagococcus sp.]